MCGIVGAIGYERAPIIVQTMSDALVHRGPDGSGIWSGENGRIALGHRRLAIIDLSTRAAQPMSSADGRFVLVYNGEIYNFAELRQELEVEHRVRFDSTSDTEVLLNGFAVWGESVIQRLNGMFAFAIFDRQQKKTYLVRDRLGVKPLYWTRVGESILFASEMKSLLGCNEVSKEISETALQEFLSLGYVASPRTLLGAIQKLPPATVMTIDSRNKCHARRYWSVALFEHPTTHRSMDEAVEELEPLLVDAFTKRMISDVPVGLYLSGGVDSSLLAALLVRSGASPRAFTLAIRESGYDESVEAAATARTLGIEHTIEDMSIEDVKCQIAHLPIAYDEPLADTSALPTLAISKAAAHHVKVVLSADGGDELFGGYRRYQWSASLERALRIVPRDMLRDLVQLAKRRIDSWILSDARGAVGTRVWKVRRNLEKLEDVLAGNDAVSRYLQWNAIAGKGVMRCLFQNSSETPVCSERYGSSGRSFLDVCMATDVLSYLPDDILMKVDRATMAASMEGRDPFLDHRIVEFSAALPIEQKIRAGNGKVLLKELLRRHGLPGPARARKRGFSMPVAKWLMQDWRVLMSEHVNESRLSDLPGLNVEAVMTLQNRFYSGDSGLAGLMYALLCLSMWRAQWKV